VPLIFLAKSTGINLVLAGAACICARLAEKFPRWHRVLLCGGHYAEPLEEFFVRAPLRGCIAPPKAHAAMLQWVRIKLSFYSRAFIKIYRFVCFVCCPCLAREIKRRERQKKTILDLRGTGSSGSFSFTLYCKNFACS